MPKGMKAEDWDALQSALQPRVASGRDYNAISGAFSKVAFDVYRDNADGSLWELREVDGKKVLFALYEDDTEHVKTASVATKWTAYPDSQEQNVTLLHGSTPIFRFAADQYGFVGEAGRFASYVATRAARDPEFVNGLLNQLTPMRREAALRTIKGEN